MAKYRLLKGKHASGKLRKQRIYRPGDIIISDYDLCKQNHPNPAVEKKFELIEGSEDIKEKQPLFTDAINNSDDLDSLKVSQLREKAEEEEIDLTGKTSKMDIIAAIREHGVQVVV